MNVPTYTVREANLPADYPAISAVLRSDWEGAASADDLAREDALHDPQLYFKRFVACLPDGPVVGAAEIGHDTWAHREGKFEFGLWVLQEHWGQGVGKALYQAVLDHAHLLKADELHTDAWAAHPRSVRFIEARGFSERWRRISQELDLREREIAAPPQQLDFAGEGIRLQTYAQLIHDPQRDAKLHALNREVWADVPVASTTLRNRPLAQFVQDDLRHPDFLPDACFVAVNEHGDYVGFTFHRHTDEEELNIETTGVLRAYRRRGIGLWLKQHALYYAKTHGYVRLATVNDPSNVGMLAVNEQLGFKPIGAHVRYAKGLV